MPARPATALLAWLATCLLLVLATLGPLPRLDNVRLDMQWRLLRSLQEQRAPTDDPNPIVVVGLDDASLRELALPIATLHRPLGDFLRAMAQAQVRAVGVDMVLPETSYDGLQPGLDLALARGIATLRSRAPLVFGLGAQADGSPRPVLPLFERLLGTQGLATVFIPRDADGVTRRFDERLGEGGATVPTLAGQLARQLQWPLRPGVLPLHRGEPFQPLPLSQVLQWQAQGDEAALRRHFQGRVVLLGSLLAHDDQHRAALPLATTDQGGQTHGVFLHAMQLRALAGGGPAREWPWPVCAALAAALALTALLRPTAARWALVAGGALLLLGASALAFDAGWHLPATTWVLALLLGLGLRSLADAVRALAERRRLRLAFDGAVSPPVLQAILSGRLSPQAGGERRAICVLFADLRDFTTLSEHLPPEDVTALLNRYFEHMTQAIHCHGGTLDKFIGDGIMAFFGAPQALPTPCVQALDAAQAMHHALATFNTDQARLGGPRLQMGIGLHWGDSFVGFVGARSRHAYSAIGDTVNTAARLEGLCKTTGWPVVLSDAVLQQLEPVWHQRVRPLGEQMLKGHSPLPVHGWNPDEDNP